MKYSIIVSAAILSGVIPATQTNADAAATDSLTKLPLPSVAGSLQIAGELVSIPDFPVCKSKGRMNFYSEVTGKVDAAIAWYSSNLKGFQHVHGYAGGRSQDIFFNTAGTLIVSITGMAGADGQITNVQAITYGTIEPGVSAKVLAGVNAHNVVCP